ncbi:hypothetical protein M434DRAFT_36585 [Hypoxylon sp. CO27-5]|nr:hypothetical protein M434DRAFT_36585 [Hypoxylon sp. CO27-5]
MGRSICGLLSFPSIHQSPSIYFAGYGICGLVTILTIEAPLPLSTRATNGRSRTGGEETHRAFLPFLWSPFFYILRTKQLGSMQVQQDYTQFIPGSGALLPSESGDLSYKSNSCEDASTISLFREQSLHMETSFQSICLPARWLWY